MYERQPVSEKPEWLVTTLAYDPDSLNARLADGEMRRNPEECAITLAAADRSRWIGTYDPGFSGKWFYGRAWNALENSPGWGLMLRDVKSGSAQPHVLQLALESAVRSDGQINGAWWALSELVKYRHSVQFNPLSPQLLASAQTELMKGMGLFVGLDVADPNPLVAPMTQRLNNFIGSARQSTGLSAKDYGQNEIVPPDVWWTAKALEQFGQDAEAYSPKNKSVLYAYGRSWRFLADPDARKRYDAYLSKRAAEKDITDGHFYEIFQSNPSALDATLRSGLNSAETEAPEGSNKETYNMQTTEKIAAAWAAVTLRQGENALQPVITRHWPRVQQVLEPYVLDGLPLVAQGKASLALRLLTHEGLYDEDDRISVFTSLYGSEESDRCAAGQAISDYLRLVYKQAATNPEDGRPSLGYPPDAPEIGVSEAYRQLIDTAKTNFPPGMLKLLIDRFQSTVEGLKGAKRQIVLPREVEQAVFDPPLLARKLNRARERGWTSS